MATLDDTKTWLEHNLPRVLAEHDVPTAAASVYVHPNTFRYRLRRLAQVGGIDLSDPGARFAAMLQLRTVVGV